MVLPVSQHLLFTRSVVWRCQAGVPQTTGLAATFKASVPQFGHTRGANQRPNSDIWAHLAAISAPISQYSDECVRLRPGIRVLRHWLLVLSQLNQVVKL